MDPQLQSILTSVGLAVATAVSGYAVSKGYIPGSDQSNFAGDLVSIGGVIVAAILAWIKTRQVSQTSMIQAVNKADNGVTVVATTPSSTALQVNAPLKALLVGLLFTAALIVSSGEAARAAPRVEGSPCIGPFCHASSAKAPASAATTAGAPAATNTIGVLSALASVQAQVVSDIQTADGLASSINPTTGAMWDPIAHMCYAGIGTSGTPGYVPGLLAFIQGLPTPASLPSAPNGSGGLVTAQEDARLVVIATRTAINNIAAVGYPTALMQACGSLVNDDANGLVVGSVGVNALLLKWIPGAAIGAIALPKI